MSDPEVETETVLPGALSTPTIRGSVHEFEAMKDFLVVEGTGPASNAEITEYLQSKSSKIPKTVVNSVQLKKKMFNMSKKVYYEVSCVTPDGKEFQCARTYNEFKRLQEALQTRFVCGLIPPLPASKAPRPLMLEGLHNFLKDIARNPIFREDTSFVQFTENTNAKYSQKAIQGFPDKSSAIERWEKTISLITLPGDCTKYVSELSKELATMRIMYKKSKEDMHNMHMLLKKQRAEQRTMSQMFEGWLGNEGRDYHILYGAISDPRKEWGIAFSTLNMPTLIDQMKRISDNKAEAFQREADKFLEDSQNTLRFEVGYLTELNEILEVVKDMVKKNSTIMQRLVTWKAQLKTIEEANPKHGELKAKIDSTIEAETKRQVELKLAIRGLIFEAERYRFERTERAAYLMRGLIDLQKNDAASSLDVCDVALRQIPEFMPVIGHSVTVNEFLEQNQSGASPLTRRNPKTLGHDIVPGTPTSPSKGSPKSAKSPTSASVPPPVAPPPNGQSKKMTVAYDFVAEESGELSVFEGDVVDVVHQENDEWYTCKNASGDLGLIPVSYLVTADEYAKFKFTDDVEEEDESNETSGHRRRKSAYSDCAF